MRNVVSDADELVRAVARLELLGPITLHDCFSRMMREPMFFNIVGVDFNDWLVIFNIVQNRLLYSPYSFGKNSRLLQLCERQDPDHPQTTIGRHLPDCLDSNVWNMSVARYVRSRQ